jgi:non-specific serine/threonine protein kinase
LEGARDKAFETMNPEFEEAARWDHSIAGIVADGYALLGERTKALDWLEIAITRGFINYPHLSKNDPFLENIRQDTRFKRLMEKVKYAWKNFEV